MERIKEINRPAISSFAEADLSLAARLLFKFKQIQFNLFSYLQGDDYTLALPINSPPGAQGRGIEKKRIEDQREDSASRGFFTMQRALSNSEIF